MTAWATSPYPPRAWQAEALPLCVDALHAGKRAIVQAVMGSGKSLLIAELCHQLCQGLGEEWRIVLTTPTRALVRQLVGTLQAHGVGASPFFSDAKGVAGPVIVCCVPSAETLAARLAEAGLRVGPWLADEAHRTNADRISAAIERMAPFSVLGFSATPFMASERRRLKHFDELLYAYSAADAIRDGVVMEPELVHWDGTEWDVDIDTAVAQMVSRESGPGIVSAANIDDAEFYAGFLFDHDVPAAAIHSKQDKETQNRLLERLRIGDLSCLVHVQLLTEGVDLPWLEWLALRAPMTSRVSFCQMVGRVLRYSDGKPRPRVLDPHDLFNEFALDYEAVLGCDVAEKNPVEKLAEEVVELMPESGVADYVVPMDEIAKYMRKAALALRARGLVELQKHGSWRRDFPSVKQQRAVRRLAPVLWRVPEPHLTLLTAVVESDDLFHWSKGDLSDCLAILNVTRRLGRWPLGDSHVER